MDRTKLKIFTFIINIILMNHVLASSEQRVLNFERECLDSELEVESEAFNACVLEHEELVEFLAVSEEELTGDSARQCVLSDSEPTPTGLEALSASITEASSQLSCTPEDQEEVASSCQDELFCNAGRSISSVLNKMPFGSRLARRTGDYFSSRVSEGQAESCSDSNNTDCLTEVFTVFFANLIGTANSLRTIASGIGSAVSSLWSNEEYVEEKSDDLLELAATKASYVSRLWNSPGETIMESLTSFKSSVDSWIKSEVFCQKWIREPHAIPTEEEREAGLSSTCEEPLEAYGCLNCNDGLNAFCAGAGIFLSEGVVAMATAGTASVMTIGARASVMAVRGMAASRRGAAAISSRVPLVGRISGEAATTSRSVASVSDNAVVAATRTTGVMASLGNVRRVVGAFTDKIANLRAVRIATAPVRAIDDIAARMVERTTRRAVLLKGDGLITSSIRNSAKVDYRVARAGRRQIDVRNVRAPRRIITGSRFLRRSRGPRSRSPRDTSPNSGGGDGPAQDRSPTADRNPNDTPDQRTRSEEERAAADRQAADREAQANRDREEREQRDREEREQRDREDEERRRAEELRLAEEAARARRATNPALAATRAALAADLAVKGVDALNSGSEQIAEQMLSDAALNNSEAAQIDGQTQGEIKSSIEERVGEIFENSEEAAQFANNMNEIYSNPDNREEVIDQFVDQRGISREQASRAYDSEKDFYGRAARGLSNESATRALAEATAAAVRSPSAVVTEEPTVSELIDSAQSISRIKQSLNELEAENKRIEEELASEITDGEAGPVALPRPTASALAARATGPQNRGSEGILGSLSPGVLNNGSDSPVAEISAGELTEEDAPLVSEEEKAQLQIARDLAQAASEEEERLASLEEARQSQLRIERTTLLSDLMNMLTSENELSFRALSSSEVALLGASRERLSSSLEMDSVRVLEIPSHGRNYLAYKDLMSNRTIFVEASTGRYIENIPPNLF